jgi:RNA polymerase sigma factor (sigma-70 family)
MADLNNWGDLQPYLHFLRCRTRTIGLDPRMQAKFDLDDIVHEVILRAMDSAEPAEPARLTWLTTILECVIIDKWRELNAGKRDLDREVRFRKQLAESTACWENSFAASQLSPSECAMQNETRLRVVDAVERLPEREREVAVLHFFAGMSLAATAEVLGLTRGAVGNLHRNVMSFLRKNLDG